MKKINLKIGDQLGNGPINVMKAQLWNLGKPRWRLSDNRKITKQLKLGYTKRYWFENWFDSNEWVDKCNGMQHCVILLNQDGGRAIIGKSCTKLAKTWPNSQIQSRTLLQ